MQNIQSNINTTLPFLKARKMDHQFHDLNKQQQNIPKPKFDVIDPSIVRAQFIAKKDVSFSSYLHQTQTHQNKYIPPQTGQIRAGDSDQISIFDAAKYFSGLHDDKKEDKNPKVGAGLDHLPSIPPRLSSVSSSIDDDGSNYGGRNSNSNSNNNSNNYRARSFHATPTASSEASWNSQTGLLANPPGSSGVCLTKNLSPNNSSNTTPRWSRISTKWLIPRRKCPCSGKKSVQVEERIESNTPRMVDLRRSTSSNGSATNYISSSWYSPKQNNYSPKKGVTRTSTYTSKSPVTPSNVVNSPVLDPNKNPNIINHHHHHNHNQNNHDTNTNTNPNPNPKAVSVVGPLGIISTKKTTTSCNTNGFTFPILDNPPIGVKKMFNVIAEPPRDSLEVYQPRSHPSPKSRRTSYEDDNVLSDGSSDLFEIESFTTNSYPFRDSMDEVVVPVSSFNSNNSNTSSTLKMKRLGIVCRNNSNNISHLDENEGLDEPMTPSIAPTECYAPSEVSIDWSVTTAEGYDRGSVSNFSVSASEVGLYAAMRRESERNNGGGGGGGGGDHEDRRGSGKGGGGKGNNNNGGGLLSCRCEKAVSVGPGPIKCSAEGGPPRHVSGRPTQHQPHHGVAAHVNGRWK